MRAPLLVLGTNPVHLAENAFVEPERARGEDLEKLLAVKPRAAVITSGGLEGFFRASLCLERGVSRVVLRRGVFDEAWERELAARAATFGAELFVHDDARGYGRVKPGARVAVGIPDERSWSSEFVVDAVWAERVRHAEPLEMDLDIAGLPSNLEEVAFAAGEKPVLYLVLPAREMESLQAKYADVTIVRREIPLAVEGATGRRVYATEGEANAHVFLSRDSALAHRAAQLWDAGSSRNAVAIGELMGYPACCVAAFVALGERGNNAALTYVTASRSRALGASFHWVLNSPVRHVVPCTPCTYGCARAITWAERIMQALPTHVGHALRRALARPVLYFDEARAVAFEGARVEGMRVDYESARFLPASAPVGPAQEIATQRLFGALFAGPGTLLVKDEGFEVHAQGGVLRLARTKPQVGILLPFGGRS